MTHHNIRSPLVKHSNLLKNIAYILWLLGFSSCSDKECPPGHFGPNCQTCTCQNGECNDGINGDGKCKECTGSFWGENCNQKPTCVNGTPSLGIAGNGKCSDCFTDTGWSGENCDDCATDSYWGESCDKKPTCVNGTPSLGVNGNGKCRECFGDYWGENCDNLAVTCVNGTPSLGANGDGTCRECSGDYWGKNCDNLAVTCVNGTPSLGAYGNGKCRECFAGTAWSGDNCDQCPLTEGKTGTLIDSNDNNKTYKTIVVNCQEWMAENYARVPTSGHYYHANNSADNDNIYGLLYDWETASAINFCPTMWRLPTRADFDYLLTYVEKHRTSNSNFLALIAKSTAWTAYSNQGGDNFGFGALPAGAGGNYNFGSGAYFWSASGSTDFSVAVSLWLDGSVHVLPDDPYCAYSVRCIKDSN